MTEPKKRSKSEELLEQVLVGTIEAVARAGARFVESLASDGRKFLRNQSAKVGMIEQGVKSWREQNAPEIEDLAGEVPSELEDDAPPPAQEAQH